jgi:TonB family protein
VCGNGIKEAGEQCDDGNTRDGDGCSSKCVKEVAAAPVTIAPSALELQRVSGNTDVHPGKQTRAAMIHAGVSSVKGTVRLCADTAGAVTESTLTESTGYDDYDRKLVAAVRDWRFRPYVVNGTAFSVCSTAEFVYVPR